MPYCGAPGCNNRSETQKVDNVKGYHDVPNEGELREKWIAALKREPPYPNEFVVCRMHFNDDDFERDLISELMGK